MSTNPKTPDVIPPKKPVNWPPKIPTEGIPTPVPKV